MRDPKTYAAALLAAAAMLASACGTESSTEAAAEPVDGPTIAVSTNIMGDVVQNLVGDAANVITIMPVGADPHDFQPSARQIAELNDADAVIVNGGGFEEGLLDIIEAAEADGTPVFEAISAIDVLEFAGDEEHGEDHGDEHGEDHGDEDDEHADEEDHGDEDGDHADEEDHGDEDGEHADEDDHGDEHADEEHADEHGDDDHKEDGDEHAHHGHDGDDPHFFSDPVRMATAVTAISAFLIADVEGIDADTVQAATDSYLAELAALDEEMTSVLSTIDDADRVLVTNHEVLTYFADQYDFEIVGTVIPGGTTIDSTNAEALAELASIVEAEGIPAVFSDTSASSELAETLAQEAGGVAVVELYSESLGPEDSDGSTYLDMMLTNAERIAEALS